MPVGSVVVVVELEISFTATSCWSVIVARGSLLLLLLFLLEMIFVFELVLLTGEEIFVFFSLLVLLATTAVLLLLIFSPVVLELFSGDDPVDGVADTSLVEVTALSFVPEGPDGLVGL